MLPRLFKDRLPPPSMKLIECCPESEDLGEGVKQTNEEIELEAKEDGEEDEERTDTPYDEEGRLARIPKTLPILKRKPTAFKRKKKQSKRRN